MEARSGKMVAVRRREARAKSHARFSVTWDCCDEVPVDVRRRQRRVHVAMDNGVWVSTEQNTDFSSERNLFAQFRWQEKNNSNENTKAEEKVKTRQHEASMSTR